ncbi:MAG: hypothetical protein ACI8PG_002636 [Planctomycetota bacterium]|jgi:hypothetical protein
MPVSNAVYLAGVQSGIFMAYGYRFAPEYGLRARLLSSQGEVLGEDELVLFGEGGRGLRVSTRLSIARWARGRSLLRK